MIFRILSIALLLAIATPVLVVSASQAHAFGSSINPDGAP